MPQPGTTSARPSATSTFSALAAVVRAIPYSCTSPAIEGSRWRGASSGLDPGAQDGSQLPVGRHVALMIDTHAITISDPELAAKLETAGQAGP